MGGPRMTAQDLANMVAWRAQGYSHKQIGRRLGRAEGSSAAALQLVDYDTMTYRNEGTTIEFGHVPSEEYYRKKTKPTAQMEFATAPVMTVTLTVADRLKNINYIMTTHLDPEVKLSVIKSMVTV